jgi:hypothetical protein
MKLVETGFGLIVFLILGTGDFFQGNEASLDEWASWTWYC